MSVVFHSSGIYNTVFTHGVRGCTIHVIGAYIVFESNDNKSSKSALSPSQSFTPVLNKFPVSVLTCTSHPLTVAQSYPLAHLVSTCHCVPALLGEKEVGTLPQSFISFPVTPSNTARCQSVELLGHITSPLHCPSAQSETVKDSESPLVSVMVTVVIFQLLELVILAIPFQSSPSVPSLPSAPSFQSFHAAPVSHLSPLGIVKFSIAAELVPELVTLALVPAAPVVVVPTVTVAAAHGVHGLP